MATSTGNKIKLGAFVMGGLAFLILLLYVIGKNQNLFGNTFELKTRFSNISGLRAGNNVRFAGIDAGTVKGIDVLNDSTIEVTLLIRNKLKGIIRKSARASIGTDGLMGNKIVNLIATGLPAEAAAEGDLLAAVEGASTDQMLDVLKTTNEDIAVIASELKTFVQRLNQPNSLWTFLDDSTLSPHIRATLLNIQRSSEGLNRSIAEADRLIAEVRTGRGAAGTLISDTTVSADIRATIQKLRQIAHHTDSVVHRAEALVAGIDVQVNNRQGTVGRLLNDPAMAEELNQALIHVRQSARDFDENMEALKHSFLLRGYFRRKERTARQAGGNY